MLCLFPETVSLVVLTTEAPNETQGSLFPFFLNYLRNGSAVVQKRDVQHLYALLQEAEFYGFQELSEYLVSFGEGEREGREAHKARTCE